MSLHSSFALFLAVTWYFFLSVSRNREPHIFYFSNLTSAHFWLCAFYGLKIGVSMKVSVCFDKLLCGNMESILKDV